MNVLFDYRRFFTSLETRKTGRDPSAKPERLARMQEKILIKIESVRCFTTTTRVRGWQDEFCRDLVKCRRKSTRDAENIIREIAVPFLVLCKQMAQLISNDRMQPKKLGIQFKRRVDSSWSWVVCLAAFIVQFFVVGTINSFGSFFVAFLEEFQGSEGATGKRNIQSRLFCRCLQEAQCPVDKKEIIKRRNFNERFSLKNICPRPFIFFGARVKYS